MLIKLLMLLLSAYEATMSVILRRKKTRSTFPPVKRRSKPVELIKNHAWHFKIHGIDSVLVKSVKLPTMTVENVKKQKSAKVDPCTMEVKLYNAKQGSLNNIVFDWLTERSEGIRMREAELMFLNDDGTYVEKWTFNCVIREVMFDELVYDPKNDEHFVTTLILDVKDINIEQS